MANVHTHSAYDTKYYGDRFSDNDRFWANLFRHNAYVATPGGMLRKYDVKTKNESTVSWDIPSDPNYVFRWYRRKGE